MAFFNHYAKLSTILRTWEWILHFPGWSALLTRSLQTPRPIRAAQLVFFCTMTFVNYLIQIILVCIHFTSLCRSPTDCTPIYSKCIAFLKPIPHTNDSTTPITASSPTENNIELACEMKLQHCWYSIHIWISTVVKNPLKASIYLLLGIAVLFWRSTKPCRLHFHLLQ
jgi:hypothetical protein